MRLLVRFNWPPLRAMVCPPRLPSKVIVSAPLLSRGAVTTISAAKATTALPTKSSVVRQHSAAN
jgi:hypothetical protein